MLLTIKYLMISYSGSRSDLAAAYMFIRDLVESMPAGKVKIRTFLTSEVHRGGQAWLQRLRDAGIYVSTISLWFASPASTTSRPSLSQRAKITANAKHAQSLVDQDKGGPASVPSHPAPADPTPAAQPELHAGHGLHRASTCAGRADDYPVAGPQVALPRPSPAPCCPPAIASHIARL